LSPVAAAATLLPGVPTNFDILDKAEKVELMAAELYDSFAKRFAEDGAARTLFERLRDEEGQHAARIRMLAAQSRRDGKLLGKIVFDATGIDEVLREMMTIIANVRAGKWSADLPQTKRILLDLEERASRAHAQFLAQGNDDKLRKFFDALAQQDKAHEALLKG
jgi:rubrerythrin